MKLPLVHWSGAWFFLSTAFLWLPLQGQEYSIDSFILSSGGGESSNGDFSVTGVIGQPASNETPKDGSFEINAGFVFTTVMMDMPEGPVTLSIMQVGEMVTISWFLPQGSSSTLEAAVALGDSMEWVPVEDLPVLSGQLQTVIVPLSGGQKFFRLRNAGP